MVLCMEANSSNVLLRILIHFPSNLTFVHIIERNLY